LHVSAKDRGTGKEQKITITASSGLDDTEIKKMVDEAESHAEEDQARRDSVETKNMAENTVYQTEKMVKEHGDKVPDDKKAKVESAVEDLKKAIEGGNVDDMKAKMETLNTEMQAISSEMYAQASAQQQTAGEEGGEQEQGNGPEASESASSESKEKEDVIDADFEMVDDDKQS